MPRESSAVMRFIDLVQNQPIIERPLEEPITFAEPSGNFRLPTQAMDTQVVRTLPGPSTGGRSKLWYVAGAVAFLGLGIGIGVLANGGGSPDAAGAAAAKSTAGAATSTKHSSVTPTPTSPPTQPPGATPPPAPTIAAAPIVADKDTGDKASVKMTPEQLGQTGFDIRVSQEGATVALDGKPIGKAPLRVRKLSAGVHAIEITAPSGFVSVKKEVELSVGEAKEVTIELEKVAVKLPATVVASFTSEPPGATVTLFTNDQQLIAKTTPIKMKLRTGHEYVAQFSRKGYETIKRPLQISDDSELKVAVVMLAKPVARTTRRVATAPRRNLRRPARKARVVQHRARTKKVTRTATATARGYGTLLIGSKPPCSIYVDGRPTGLTTPQRGLKLKAGSHRISLVNRQFNIRRTISVTIRAGQRTRVIRDFSDKVR